MAEMTLEEYRVMDKSNDFKTHFIMVVVFLTLLVASTGVGTWAAYKVGKSAGKAEGINEAYKLHPPVIMTGASPQMITNNNVREKKDKFSLGIWPLHAGWCE